MGLKFKMQYLKKIYHRYRKASRAEKTQMLNEFCKVCNYNRKYAIWLLNEPPKETVPEPRKRNYIYGPKVISILQAIWEATGYLCSQRLKAALHLWIPWVKQRFNITPEIEKQLLSMSSATIDRRLKSKKYRIRKRLYSTTKPGVLLKHEIPVKTNSWDINKPGFLEVDLVSHSGSSAEGDFIYTLSCVDIQTTWVERRAVFGKGQTGVIESFDDIRQDLPFPLLGIDSDNGSEFINWHLKAFCDKQKIEFTRSRPYKKDDNAHIEQKNWTHVRKIFGYVRYDSDEALEAMNDLYRNELKCFQNFFQPSVKLIKKIRIGAKIKRIYGSPKTPFERVCNCKDIDSVKVLQLKQLFKSLNPFELSKTIEQKLNRIYSLKTKRKRTRKSFDVKFQDEVKKDFFSYNYS